MKSIKNLGGTKDHNRKLSFCLKVCCAPIICMGRMGIRGSLRDRSQVANDAERSCCQRNAGALFAR